MSGAQTYTLKVTLVGTRRPIWRRLDVPADISLAQLHDVLQIAMGWTDSHLHQFEANRVLYGPPDPEIQYSRKNEKKTRLSDVLRRPKDKMTYEYDFGDSWTHEIVLERTTEAEEPAVARVVKSKGACPPEDVGGVHGYERFVEVIGNPNHDEHADLREWYGGEFDRDAYDLDAVNAQFARLRLKVLPMSDTTSSRAAVGTAPGVSGVQERFRNKLKQKLTDPAAILAEREVKYLASQVELALTNVPATALLSVPSAEDIVRWSAVAARCRQARDERGWSLKDAAKALKLPRYRVEAVEKGPVADYDLESAVRYFRLLGIETWLARWARANPDLARRQGLG